jgi:dTDP-4-dehydrorhamnose 3,5-epimerase
VEIRQLSVPDAFEVTPQQHGDDRGLFMEWFTRDQFESETGHSLGLAQANCSVSVRGVVRGIHFAAVPPGQGKYVTCVAGDVLDVVVDLRTGSSTFATWDSVRLDERERKAVYLAEGLGHAFMALSASATVVYFCSAPYNPTAEHGVNPLDLDIGIEWPADVQPLLSPKDAAAPQLCRAEADGLLPTLAQCQDRYAANMSLARRENA